MTITVAMLRVRPHSQRTDIDLTPQPTPSVWRLTIIGALAHAFFTAFFWMGPLMYAGLGLGFKDRAQWTWLDSGMAEWALPLANLLTSPGRSLAYNGIGGFVIPAVLTSAIWGGGIALLFSGLSRLRQGAKAWPP